MGHLEGNFTPVLYIGRKVPKGLNTRLTFEQKIKNTVLPLHNWFLIQKAPRNIVINDDC